MSNDIEVIRNDKLFEISFIVEDAKGDTLDLTDSTVRFKMWKDGEDTSQINGICVITSPVDGECKYTIQDGDLNRHGKFRAELEITYLTGKVVTAGKIDVEVFEDAPD